MTRLVLLILNKLVKSGLLLAKNFISISEDKLREEIKYNIDYSKVINADSVRLDYFNYLDESYQFLSALFKINNCFVDHQSGGVLCGRKILKHSLLNSYYYIFKAGIYKFLFRSSKYFESLNKIERGFLLTGCMSYNYFHFLIDSLPRIFDYIELLKTHPGLKLLVNHRRQFTEEYLAFFDIPEQDVLYLEHNVCVKELFFSNNKFAATNEEAVYFNCIYSKLYLSRLANHCIAKSLEGCDSSDFPERIYLSRKDVGTRVLLNEDEILGILNDKGFQNISLSGLP